MRRYTIKDFQRDFRDDAACLEWLKNHVYPNGITCENKACLRTGQVTTHYRDTKRPSYSCAYCGHHVHPTAGTIFHKSPTSLTKWFYAVYLMAQTRCGISAKQIEREVGVTYKTAWRMCEPDPQLPDEENGEPPLGSDVEADETWVGGKKHHGSHVDPRADERQERKTPCWLRSSAAEGAGQASQKVEHGATQVHRPPARQPRL